MVVQMEYSKVHQTDFNQIEKYVEYKTGKCYDPLINLK